MRSDLVLRVGAVVTVIGFLATMIALLPLFVESVELPGIWWFLSMITGIGLLLIIIGLVLAARERR